MNYNDNVLMQDIMSREKSSSALILYIYISQVKDTRFSVI